MIKIYISKTLILIALLINVTACMTLQGTDLLIVEKNEAIVGLRDLAPPDRKVSIAVYQFTDQTGQRAPDVVSSFSTAVTQGAGPILIEALTNAGNGKWFRVVERSSIDRILQERQIIRQQRQSFDDNRELEPIIFAGVMIEGGIIGYDSNLKTGGAGARYLGIGIRNQYRVDNVMISLRLISVSTSEVLLTVTTSKTILSASLAGNIFKFFDMGTELLETEVGMTENESVTYAVKEAIETAVYEMIMKGEQQKLWSFKT
jgi:curli production assembly/transport component CsgG